LPISSPGEAALSPSEPVWLELFSLDVLLLSLPFELLSLLSELLLAELSLEELWLEGLEGGALGVDGGELGGGVGGCGVVGLLALGQPLSNRHIALRLRALAKPPVS